MVLCECGCGEPTAMIDKSDARKNWVKGEYHRFVNGHNAKTVRAEHPGISGVPGPTSGTRSAFDPQDWTKPGFREVTEADIIALRDMGDIYAADVYNARARQLSFAYKRTFVELGLICTEVANRNLWRKLADPETGIYFHSIDAWIASSLGEARSSAYAAMKALSALHEVPIADLQQMSRSNTVTLSTLSTAVQRDPEVIRAAKEYNPEEFREKVNKMYPEQHVERRRAVIAKPVQSARTVMDECFEVVSWVYDIEGREDILEILCAYFMDGPCERESYSGKSNRMAFASAIGKRHRA